MPADVLCVPVAAAWYLMMRRRGMHPARVASRVLILSGTFVLATKTESVPALLLHFAVVVWVYASMFDDGDWWRMAKARAGEMMTEVQSSSWSREVSSAS